MTAQPATIVIFGGAGDLAHRKLLPAPKLLKPALLERIERESRLHTARSPGLIQFKMNALEDADVVRALYRAAQAGVRYSLENPRAYIDANIVDTFNVMECARELEVAHLLMASTSSVYGANEDMPFDEREKCDTQLTLYAATKKATESMGHSYAHLWNLPVTMFRFFTVYGPWGRPDMALFKFTKGILEGNDAKLKIVLDSSGADASADALPARRSTRLPFSGYGGSESWSVWLWRNSADGARSMTASGITALTLLRQRARA